MFLGALASSFRVWLGLLQFYLTDADIGKPRDAACVAKLAELNPYVTTTVLKDDAITESVLKRFKVVVATNTPMKQLLQWNEICRSQKPAIGFIAADVRGVAGYAFSDFGPEFSIVDKDGEQAKTAVVVGVTQVRVLTKTHSTDWLQ